MYRVKPLCDCGKEPYKDSIFCKKCMDRVMKENKARGLDSDVSNLPRRSFELV